MMFVKMAFEKGYLNPLTTYATKMQSMQAILIQKSVPILTYIPSTIVPVELTSIVFSAASIFLEVY